MTSTPDSSTAVQSSVGDTSNQLPILSAIQEGDQQMDDPELEFSGNDDEDHLGVDMEDTLPSGRCSSTLPPPIKERSIRGNVNNNSANLTAALHAVNNHQNSIKTGPAWSNREPLSQVDVDTQKPATEVSNIKLKFTRMPYFCNMSKRPPILSISVGV